MMCPTSFPERMLNTVYSFLFVCHFTGYSPTLIKSRFRVTFSNNYSDKSHLRHHQFTDEYSISDIKQWASTCVWTLIPCYDFVFWILCTLPVSHHNFCWEFLTTFIYFCAETTLNPSFSIHIYTSETKPYKSSMFVVTRFSSIMLTQ